MVSEIIFSEVELSAHRLLLVQLSIKILLN